MVSKASPPPPPQQGLRSYHFVLRCVANPVHQHGQHGHVTFGPGPTYEAFALDDNEPTVQRILEAAKLCEIEAELVSNDGGMDANWIVRHGIPAVTIGVGQRDVHKPIEWIDLGDFERACRLMVASATL